jgi:hypothetical protein
MTEGPDCKHHSKTGQSQRESGASHAGSTTLP